MYVPTNRPVESTTGIAILGCGYWGINYVRVLSELPDARVVVVCDQRAGRLDEIARRFPQVSLTTSLEEALDAPGVDAAVVCTPASTHREVTGRALEAGKHVLTEKPLTVDSTSADELVELAEQRDRVLLTGHTFLYNAGVRRVKALIDERTLGRIYYLYATRTNLGPFRSDTNALWDLAPHDVAIFNYLLGATPEWVSAVGSRVLFNGQEDVGFISLGYPDNTVGHIHVSWADPHKVREVVVVGSNRRIAFDDLDLVQRVRIFDKGVRSEPSEEPTTFGEHHLRVREGDISSPALPITEPLKHLCGHFLHCVRRGEAPQTPGADGRDVVAVMEAIQRSVERRGAPVSVAAVGKAVRPLERAMG